MRTFSQLQRVARCMHFDIVVRRTQRLPYSVQIWVDSIGSSRRFVILRYQDAAIPNRALKINKIRIEIPY